jgi:hypothetical protein
MSLVTKFITIHLVSSSGNYHLYVTIFIVVLNITWLGVENAARRSTLTTTGDVVLENGVLAKCTCRHRTTSAASSFPVALTTTRDENGVLMLASHHICWQSFLGSLKRYLRASLSTACMA